MAYAFGFNRKKRRSLTPIAVAISAKINYLNARLPLTDPDFVFLFEFPRSGGNWIRDMIADCLEVCAPRYSRLPVDCESILLSHDHRPLRRQPSIYVVRDARDVFLSHFAKAKASLSHDQAWTARRARRFHASLTRGDVSEEEALHLFYEEWKTRPIGSRVNWGQHVRSWLANPSETTQLLRYEDFANDPVKTLVLAAERLSEREVDFAKAERAVEKNSFRVKTGRAPGEADPASSKRKGVAGAWRTDMPPSLILRFEADFGEDLNFAGYPV